MGKLQTAEQVAEQALKFLKEAKYGSVKVADTAADRIAAKQAAGDFGKVITKDADIVTPALQNLPKLAGAGMALPTMNPLEQLGGAYNYYKTNIQQPVADTITQYTDPSQAVPGYQPSPELKEMGRMAFDPANLAGDVGAAVQLGAEALPQQKSNGGEIMDFKKLHETDTHLIMQHPDGHELHIRKYANGGDVAPQQNGATGDFSEPAPTQQAAPQMQQQMPTPQTFAGMNGGFQQQMNANQEMANVASQQGATESNAINDVQAKIDALPSQNDIVAAHQKKSDDLFNAYQSGKIDPDRFWKNQDTGSKIAAGLGMLLSGFGGGAAHQTPMAQDMIQKAIDRDIDAQKNDQSKNFNLYQMNKEALGNDLAANLATQNQMYTGLKFKLQQAASQFHGPQAQAQAHAANALIQQQLDMNNFKLSLMNGPTKESMDPASKVPWLVPQEHQAKALAEIETAQNTKSNEQEILKSFDDAAKGKNLTDLIPGTLNADQKKLHALLGPTFKDVEGTVRQAAMDNMFNNATPQAFDSKKTLDKKREALVGYLTSKKSAPTAKAYGIDLQQYPSTTAEQPAETKTMNGQQYKKVNGGWSRVK